MLTLAFLAGLFGIVDVAFLFNGLDGGTILQGF